MSGPLEQAWALLKAMTPFMPTSPDQQLGMGSYRAAYRQEGVPHVTKFGTGENLADTVILSRLGEMHPEAFVAEEVHPMPRVVGGRLPEWLTEQARGPDAGDFLEYHDYQGEVDRGQGMAPGQSLQLGTDPVVHPFVYTQPLGNPLESTELTEQYSPQRALLDRVAEAYPLTGALGMFDAKPENVFADDAGIPMPEYGEDVTGKFGDPMFGHRRIQTFYTPEFRALSQEFRQDLPEVRDFAEPWYAGLDNYDDPEEARMVLDEIVRQGEIDLAQRTRRLTP